MQHTQPAWARDLEHHARVTQESLAYNQAVPRSAGPSCQPPFPPPARYNWPGHALSPAHLQSGQEERLCAPCAVLSTTAHCTQVKYEGCAQRTGLSGRRAPGSMPGPVPTAPSGHCRAGPAGLGTDQGRARMALQCQGGSHQAANRAPLSPRNSRVLPPQSEWGEGRGAFSERLGYGRQQA